MDTITKEKLKSSYKEELNNLLAGDPFSIMWIQKVDSKRAMRLLILNIGLFVASILYYFYVFKEISIITVIQENLFSSWDLLVILYLAIVFIGANVLNTLVASTISYAILPSGICFSWRKFKKHVVNIPFHEINAINLVKYDDTDHSTIYFGTNKPYKINKMNFDTAQPRAHITFEKVKNGDKVFELLNTLWKKNLKDYSK